MSETTPAQEATQPQAQDATTPVAQATTDTTKPQQQTAQTAQAASDFDALPDWAQKQIRDLRAEAAKHRKSVEKVEKDAAEQQGKFKELYEAERKSREEIEARLREAELSVLRRKAGAKYGLPEALAERLRGEDETAILEDAKAVAAVLPKAVASNDARTGTNGNTGVKSYGGLTMDEITARYGIKVPKG